MAGTAAALPSSTWPASSPVMAPAPSLPQPEGELPRVALPHSSAQPVPGPRDPGRRASWWSPAAGNLGRDRFLPLPAHRRPWRGDSRLPSVERHQHGGANGDWGRPASSWTLRPEPPTRFTTTSFTVGAGYLNIRVALNNNDSTNGSGHRAFPYCGSGQHYRQGDAFGRGGHGRPVTAR